jgi:hypothetical protein
MTLCQVLFLDRIFCPLDDNMSELLQSEGESCSAGTY